MTLAKTEFLAISHEDIYPFRATGLITSLAGAIALLAVSAIVGCGSSSASNTNRLSNVEGGSAKPAIRLLNVSYDPTRELYAEFNQAFSKYWLDTANQKVTIEQSHAASGAQARAVIDGLKADVVTLAIAYDIDQIAELSGKLPSDWQNRLSNNSSPYRSTVVFLVRKGNPKRIKDWRDLVRPGVEVITANPKTSGAGRLAYLAAWGYSLKKNENDEAKAKEFVSALYKNVPVLDSGARGSTTTFIQRGIGDVLLAWENEAFLAIEEQKGAAEPVELVVPSLSISAEPPVALVDKNAGARETQEVATAYLEYLYSPEGQEIAVKHYYRPSKAEGIDAASLAKFPEVSLFTVKDVFGSWREAQEKHFKDGAIFDEITTSK